MDIVTTIHERIKDLQKDCDLTLEQLEAQIGLLKSSLGRYEGDGPRDISLNAVIKPAQFYGVTTDYLLGLAEQKNHPDAEVIDLHLSDEMLDILRSGKINNCLLCEIVTHSKFHRLLADIEVYVDRIVNMQIDNLNATVATTSVEALARENPDENDLYLRTLEAAYVPEDSYFTYGSVEPVTGENCFLVLPSSNTICMNLFLCHLSKQYPDDTILLCWDGAAWHKSETLCVPENIRLFFYSSLYARNESY